MSQPKEQFVRGWFRAEYRGEQQPDSMRVGGSDYALEITRGAELTEARPTVPYLASAQLDERTFQTAVLPRVRVDFANAGSGEARLVTLYNVLVRPVQLREVVCHGNTVYGVLEGEALATLGQAEGAASLTEPPRPPAPARGLWRLGCMLPLLTLGVGGCLASQGLWGGGATVWQPGRAPAASEELTPDLDTPDLDSLALNKLDTDNQQANSASAATGRQPAPELPVSGTLLSVALSDWSRADGDQVQVLLNGQPVGQPLTLQTQPTSILLRLPPADTVSVLQLETRSQGSLGITSVRVELNDGRHPSREYDLRGQVGRPLTLRLSREPGGAAFTTDSTTRL